MGKCCCLIFILIVATVILGVSIGVPLAVKKAKEKVNEVTNDVCQATSYPETCNQTLSSGNLTASDSRSVTRLSLQSANTGVNQTWQQVLFLNGSTTNINVTYAAEICGETLGVAQEQIAAALSELQSMNATGRQQALNDIKAWVSAAMEMHTTCIDALVLVADGVGQQLLQQATQTDQLFSNALAFVNALAKYGDDLTTWKNTAFGFFGDLTDLHIPSIPGVGNRKLLSSDWMSESNDVPNWVDAQTQRHLLQANTYNVMVAKDGSGDYTTIQAAVDAHKVNNARFVIYVKAGIYNEQVIVPKKCKYLTIVGDGDTTILTGSRNVALMSGMTTFKSATLIVSGEGFIGKSFLVQNTAGAAGHQAVAFRGSADKIAMYKVTFDSYQDTLYAHSFRQFYRECTIRGTVDFIFGNGAASFQSCYVVAKKTTLPGQQNTYSAQGRTDPHQNTGLAFQNCTFDGTTALKADITNYKTFLGRPWKAYSRCVLLKSELMGHIDPTGWLPWNTSTFGLYTSYFAEYQSSGAGANPTKRVSWSKQISLPTTADDYIATNFVQASQWVPNYGIPLTTRL